MCALFKAAAHTSDSTILVSGFKVLVYDIAKSGVYMGQLAHPIIKKVPQNLHRSTEIVVCDAVLIEPLCNHIAVVENATSCFS